MAPTCTETGLTEGKHCSVCNAVLIAQEVVAAAHAWSIEFEWDKGYHWQICSACEEVKAKDAHTLGTDGYCTVCDNPIAGSDGVFYWPSDDGTYAEVIDYSGISTRVVIAEEYEGLPVTHIAQNAFENKGITSIVLPSSLTHIGASAFSGCSSLQSIIVPDSVVDIASKAFYGCSSLMSVTIGDSVTSIGTYAFYNCSKLTSVIMGGSVASIGSDAFYYCSKLYSVSINNSVSWCNISFGNSYANPLYYAHNFYVNDTLVKELVIPAEITVVKAYAFAGGSQFEAIVIHDNVTAIGTGAFQNCSGLKTVTLPAFAITDIPTSNLVSVTVTSGTSIASSAFKNCRYLKSVTLAQSVIEIGSSAFYGCSALETIVFPADLVSIGSSAFYGCTKLIETVNGVSYVGDYLIGFDNSSALVAVRAGTKIIAASAFSGCSKLRLISFPDTVKSICDSAFYNCTNMTSITIPDSVIMIGGSAFYGCICFTSITIPDSVTSLGQKAFYNCSGLTSIIIPDSVISIGYGAFSGCSSLESITLPFVGGSRKTASDTYQYPFGYIFGTSSYTGGVATKQYYYGSSTSSTTNTTYYIPSSLKSVTITGGNILRGAFYNCSGLTSVTIPDSVTSIGRSAFGYCSKLTSVTIPDSVTSIGDYTFAYCDSLTSITIPDSTTTIGNYAFKDCTRLSIYCEVNKKPTDWNKYWNDSDCPTVWGFLNTGSTPDGLVWVEYKEGVYIVGYIGSKTNVTIPETINSAPVIEIRQYAFSNCSNLTSVTIPNSVTEIGYSVFYGCSSLESITIPFVGYYVESYYNYDYPFGYIFGRSSYTGGVETKQSYYIYSSSTDSVSSTFYIPASLNSVTVTGREICFGAFYNCSNLTSVTIGDSVTSIGRYAFYGCNNLIVKENGIHYVDKWAVGYDSDVTVATLRGDTKGIAKYAFYYCSSLASVTIPDSVTSIGSYAFSGCSSLTSITIPDSVTSIDSYAFYNCSSLTSATIPNSVTEIGYSAFSNCSSLTSVTIGDSVITIGDYAFSNCSSLTSVTIPDSVNSIGKYAFYNCTALEEIYFNATEMSDLSSSNYVFYNAGKNANGIKVIIGANVTKIPAYLFSPYSNSSYSPKIIRVEFEKDSVCERIGSNAFFGCSGLTSIIIPDSVISIGYGAFSGCSSLESITLPFVGESRKTSSDTYQYPFGYIFGTSSYSGGVATEQYYYGSSTSSTTKTIYYIPSSLKSVTITGGNILYGAFYDCCRLTSVTIGDSVTSIGNSAFTSCTGLTSVYIEDIATWCNISFGNSSANPLYYADNLYSNNELVTDLIIPDGVTEIPAYAFYGYSGLTSVTIGDSVTSIGNSAFTSCTGLTSVYIEDIAAWCNISFGDSYANPLYYADNLYLNNELVTELVIPDGATKIPAYAFYGLSSLTSITIPDSVTEIGSSAFSGCKSLTSITIPDSVTSIGDYAFSGCSGLTSITIGNSVTSIGNSAFTSCTGLTSVTIGNSVTEIGESAFYSCENLKSIKYRGTYEEWSSIKKGEHWNQSYGKDFWGHYDYYTISYTMTYNYTGE